MLKENESSPGVLLGEKEGRFSHLNKYHKWGYGVILFAALDSGIGAVYAIDAYASETARVSHGIYGGVMFALGIGGFILAQINFSRAEALRQRLEEGGSALDYSEETSVS